MKKKTKKKKKKTKKKKKKKKILYLGANVGRCATKHGSFGMTELQAAAAANIDIYRKTKDVNLKVKLES